jgi:hypothetical protein
MSEQESTTPEPGIKEKIQDLGETLQPKVGDIRDHFKTYELRTTVSPLQVVSTVALVGILWTSRRHLKFTKKVIRNMDQNMLSTQETIKALKNAGQTFEFYPGVGLWVD